MSVNWTEDQRHAFECRKGSVLVSAAAGSGKTAVLVERVIRRLTDSDDPCSAADLLIVTFTRAATAQMREKIGAAIMKRLGEEPTDSHLRRQYMLLPFAKICTIDSFCNDLVRENFHALGISPDYTMLDSETVKIMKSDACETVLERAYENDADGSFAALSDMISADSSDRKLQELIIKIYDISTAYPFPERWLDSLIGEYSQPDIEKSCWGGVIEKYLSDMIEYCAASSRDMLESMQYDEYVFAAYGPAVRADLMMYEELKTALGTGWDSALEAFRDAGKRFQKLGSTPRGYDSPAKSAVKTMREKLKKLIKKAPEIMCVSSAEHAEDIELLKEPVSLLIGLVKQFGEEYAREKDRINSADFSDCLHRAISLLVRPEGDGYAKTELARELSAHYKEILVDEYQDINEAQDMIFRAISADESNLFTVGDVKQSIYRFRQAMPEIFLRRRASTNSYESGKYPMGITLGTNFRSRAGVTSCVNYIFRQLMSEEAGELDYGDSEALNAGASYPERDIPDCELHIVTNPGNRAEVLEAQAEYVAQYIEKAVASGMQVTRGGELRGASFGDFCILLRTAKDTASVFANVLSKHDIPVFSPETGGFFEAAEISFMLSLMRVLDNPVQDIPLAAVMLSPLFGFNADELSEIRAAAKVRLPAGGSEPLYRSVAAAAGEGNEKAKRFLARLESLRRLSLTLSAGELVRRLCDETGFDAIVGAMPDGERRRLNLDLLCDYAEKYEAAGNLGLSGFIRFIDKIARTSGDLATAAKPSENADVVRIMTVHQSKGLEFPVCILADMQHEFNERDFNDSVLISSESGLGMKRRTEDGISLYDTAPRRAAVISSQRMGRSEEMRVLYVALTRAKENIVMVTSIEKPENKLASLAVSRGMGDRADPFAVLNMNSFSDLVLTALLRHPDAQELRDISGVETDILLSKKDKFRLGVTVGEVDTDGCAPAQSDAERAEPTLIGEVRARLDFEDPRSVLSSVPAKRAASDGSERGINREYFASARPAFMSSGGLTPAQRGTATHKYMQFSDYSAAAADPRAECERLVDMGFLSREEGEAVNLAAIKKFFSSELAARIFACENVMREKKFTALFPISYFYPELEGGLGNETTVVQGIADCAFVEDGELVIVDYKTDMGVTPEALRERYSAQLGIYRAALSQTLGMPVKETLLYSFYLGEAVRV